RPDVIVKDGFCIAPSDPRSGDWKFVRADLGANCAQMYAFDVNGDGLPDIISSSAHEIGIWWYEQKRGPHGPEFVKHLIDDSFSQPPRLGLPATTGDGLPAL